MIRVLAAVVLLCGVAEAVLPPIRLVKDVNEANLGSSPQGIGFADGAFYFSTAGQILADRRDARGHRPRVRLAGRSARGLLPGL